MKQRTSKSIWGTVLMPSEKSEISARKFPGQNWKIKRKCEQLEKRWAKYESHHNNLVITAWKVPKYRVFSGSFFPAFWLNTYWVRMRENTDHKKFRIWTLFTQCVVNGTIFFRRQTGWVVDISYGWCYWYSCWG